VSYQTSTRFCSLMIQGNLPEDEMRNFCRNSVADVHLFRAMAFCRRVIRAVSHQATSKLWLPVKPRGAKHRFSAISALRARWRSVLGSCPELERRMTRRGVGAKRNLHADLSVAGTIRASATVSEELRGFRSFGVHVSD
jgi:hypothetical protein